MEDPDGKMSWDVLLVLAEASLRQAEANIKQAVANEGTSIAIKLLCQRVRCMENDAALQSGWLDARYAANGNAEAIASAR